MDIPPTNPIPCWLTVRVARDRTPDDDDLAELLADETGYGLGVCEAAVHRAVQAGYLYYNDLSECAVIHARPTAAGLTLLSSAAAVHDGQCDLCQPPRRMHMGDLYDHVCAEHPATVEAMRRPVTESLLAIPVGSPASPTPLWCEIIWSEQ